MRTHDPKQPFNGSEGSRGPNIIPKEKVDGDGKGSVEQRRLALKILTPKR